MEAIASVAADVHFHIALPKTNDSCNKRITFTADRRQPKNVCKHRRVCGKVDNHQRRLFNQTICVKWMQIKLSVRNTHAILKIESIICCVLCIAHTFNRKIIVFSFKTCAL